MKRLCTRIWPLGIVIALLIMVCLLPSLNSPKRNVSSACLKTAKALSIMPASSLQTSNLASILSQPACEQELTLSLQSCQSENPAYDFLDNLSGLQCSLTNTADGQQAGGSYEVQYSAMPLLHGKYLFSSAQDTLSITSIPLLEGSLQLPIKDLGIQYQDAPLADFFPDFHMDASCSLSSVSEAFIHPFLADCSLSAWADALKESDVTLMNNDILDAASVYQITPAPVMEDLIQHTFHLSLSTPILIGLDSDGLVRYLQTTLADGRLLHITLVDTASATCSLLIEDVTSSQPHNLQAAFSLSCKQQRFQITVSSLTMENITIPPISDTNVFTLTCKGSYSLGIPSQTNYAVTEDTHYPVLDMERDALQTLEREIWDNIRDSPQLNMFLSASQLEP